MHHDDGNGAVKTLRSVAAAAALAAVLAAAAAGCGSGSTTSGAAGHAAAASTGAPHGTVSVLYAGSLVAMMEHTLGPAFARATHYTYQGFAAGSTELASQIKGRVRQADVFISASPKADALLQGAANGSWVSWYAAFAKAPLVIGYNPHSSYAGQFRSRPWYEVITQPGIRVGMTDPKLDPKGKLTAQAMDEAAAQLKMPSLTRQLSRFQVFPEESLVGRLEAGQLDAGFFYSNEAKEQSIPTVPITPVKASATYTVTTVRNAPDAAGAQAFIKFLLGPSGQAILRRHGLTVLAPAVTGSGAPAGLAPVLRGG